MALRTWLSPLAAIAAALVLAAPAAAESASLYVNASDDRPAGVDATRLYQLADSSAKRWKLSVAGNAGYAPGTRDGTQTLGFSRSTNPKALGVTSVWTRTRYIVKTSRRCTRVNGKRRCRTIRRYVRNGIDVVEKDVQLNPYVKWEQGPAYPAVEEYDLESTILHELGHFANPLKDSHVFGCENSPMIDSIAPGEFWRDSDDWLRYGCNGMPGSRSRTGLPAGPALPMLVEEHRLPPLVER
ncbi:MAG: hypothetical protein M3340_05955 [Actinomycetota bacterium]|nr:hypothetical protein [Actinomycetota bacterium]